MSSPVDLTQKDCDIAPFVDVAEVRSMLDESQTAAKTNQGDEYMAILLAMFSCRLRECFGQQF